jgi:hypothetical protein
MRTSWLAVIPIVLLGGTALAQGPRPTWTRFPASNYAMLGQTNAPPPVVNNSPAGSANNQGAAPNNSAPNNAANNGLYARPFNGYPPAAPPANGGGSPAQGGCARCGGLVSEHCLVRLKQWLCYRPIRGGCPWCCGCCSYNCFLPLYLYFLGECCEGGCHTLPPPRKGCDCNCLGQLLSKGKGCGATP